MRGSSAQGLERLQPRGGWAASLFRAEKGRVFFQAHTVGRTQFSCGCRTEAHSFLKTALGSLGGSCEVRQERLSLVQ